MGEYILGYEVAEIIRQAAGSPASYYSFAARSETIAIQNLGSSPIYFSVSGTANPANSGTGFIDRLANITMDLRIGSISIQASGLTSPIVQVIRLT